MLKEKGEFSFLRIPFISVRTKNYYLYIPGGTSIAAPFISGLCALILEVNPDWSPVTIMTALKETARDLGDPGPDNDYGWGIPDGVLALEYSTTGVNYNEIAQSTRYKMRKRQSYPSQGMLSDPFPNPFNAVLTIPFNLNKEALVTVDIIDITGRIVQQLWNEVTNTGTHYIMWETGLHASGTYVVRAKIGMEWETKKVLLIK